MNLRLNFDKFTDPIIGFCLGAMLTRIEAIQKDKRSGYSTGPSSLSIISPCKKMLGMFSILCGWSADRIVAWLLVTVRGEPG